jgi:hypothetical protein
MSEHIIYDTQKSQVALTGIRTTDLWIAGPLLYQFRCEFLTLIFSDQLIILASFPYMSSISPFRMRFEQVITSDIMV